MTSETLVQDVNLLSTKFQPQLYLRWTKG